MLFGGEDASGLLGDTWEWDGEGWTQVADTGPAARAGHAMCFESRAARTVLFGGSNGSDTWTWNGTEWTGINDVGPEPRQATALVSTATITILFGGIDPSSGVLFPGTWQLEGTDWTERQDIGPAKRQAHAMTYDETRQQVVLFGGSAAPSATATAADLFSDTWELPSPAAPPGTPTTRPILVGFAVIPNLVQQGTPFRLEVFLDHPAPVTASVMVTGASGSFAEEVAVAAGSTSGSSSVSPPAGLLPLGGTVLTATLDGVALTASLQIQ